MNTPPNGESWLDDSASTETFQRFVDTWNTVDDFRGRRVPRDGSALKVALIVAASVLVIVILKLTVMLTGV